MLIFDGDCAFCTRSVEFGARLFVAWPASVPSQSLGDLSLAKLGLDRGKVDAKVWLKLPGKPALGGAAAVTAILRLQPGFGWRALGALGGLPIIKQLAEGVYRLVARNRHRLPGATPACEIDNSKTGI